MGQVASGISETFGAAASTLTKSFTTMITEPKKVRQMPNLGDGRTQDQLRTTAEMMYNMDTKQHINIAFLGSSEAMKLAFINSCRFTAECKPVLGIDAPKKVATQYMHCDPQYKHVRFWDITDLLHGSFETKCLYAFDAVVILIGETLRSGDIELIKNSNIVCDDCPVLLVRPDMDFFIDKELQLTPDSTDVVSGKTHQGPIIKEGYQCQMKKAGIECACQLNSVYLCSSPGMLAARNVNTEGTRYIWDEFDFMKGLLDCVVKRRYT